MDAPLLALTRRRAVTPSGPSPDTAAAENMRQLIQLRWVAVAGQTLTILFVHYGLGIRLPVLEMLGITLVLAAANLLATVALPRRPVRSVGIMAALLLDMAALTLQLYLSGGAANPFIALYLLQVVLGAILLPPPWAMLLAAAACLSYALLSVRNVPLALPSGLLAESPDLFAVGRWIGFVMVAGLILLFITRITRNLRARDAYLADMRQHAAEEESIVRMGLFASGAAHELGTPLGTLAVILADWRREPKIASDPDLFAEVKEMADEVQRCKAIVSDILHSAGQPRGEAMASSAAAPFLDAVAEEWRLTHPGLPFSYDRGGAGDVAMVIDPALRQAIWTLLDNAAEASPAGVVLSALVEQGMLAISVQDHGQGFTDDALAHVGELYRSTKGAGHGLGLFLASNVARRLGGRLEARNLDTSGAEVRLILPLAIAAEGQ